MLKKFNTLIFETTQSITVLPPLKSNSKEDCWFNAIITGNIEEVKNLMKNNININITDRGGSTGLHYAVFHNKPEIVKELVKNSHIDTTKKNIYKQTPFDIAKNNKNCKIIDLLTRRITEENKTENN